MGVPLLLFSPYVANPVKQKVLAQPTHGQCRKAKSHNRAVGGKWGYGATVARLTPDQKVGSSNLPGLIFFVLGCEKTARVLPLCRQRVLHRRTPCPIDMRAAEKSCLGSQAEQMASDIERR